MTNPDSMITIIGAGPAGLYSSYLLAKNGFKVKIIEQKSKIGLPIQCTGIVTSKIKAILDIPDDIIINRINKLQIFSKNNSAELNLKNPDLILDRQKFDQYLSKIAKKAGVEILLKTKFQEKHKTDILIGADGPLSIIYNILNKKKRTYYKGIQARVKGNFQKDTSQVYLGSICPKFFSWVVPENENIARVGLAALDNQKKYFDNFLKKIKINNKDIIEIQAGLIPIYDPKIKTQKDNIYLVGDAASQIKSTTGGGIVQSLLAAKALIRSIRQKTGYEKEWRKVLGKDLSIHLKLRRYLDRFTDKDYDKLVNYLNNKKLKNIIETHSRDNPSGFIFKLLLAEPRLISFAGKLF